MTSLLCQTLGRLLIPFLLVILFLPSYTSQAQAAPQYNMYTCGNNGNRVLLTFDDWPYRNARNRFAEYVRILKQERTGAIFFPITQPSGKYPAFLDFLRTNHMWVGNHTYSHKNLTTLSDAGIKQEIEKGVTSNVLRPPFGRHNQRVDRIAASLGYRLCFWTLDTTDYRGKSADQIRATIRANVRPGSVILMHLFTKSLDALPGLITDIRAKGLQLCALPSQPTTEGIPLNLPCQGVAAKIFNH